MNLLLLLSALLSALTGGASAVRAPVAAHAAARVATTVQADVRAVSAANRPQQPLPQLAVSLTGIVVPAPFALATTEPLYASRRRE